MLSHARKPDNHGWGIIKSGRFFFIISKVPGRVARFLCGCIGNGNKQQAFLRLKIFIALGNFLYKINAFFDNILLVKAKRSIVISGIKYFTKIVNFSVLRLSRNSLSASNVCQDELELRLSCQDLLQVSPDHQTVSTWVYLWENSCKLYPRKQ